MRYIIIFVCALAMHGFFCAVANAEEELAPGYNACVDKANSTADNLECINEAYKFWDKQLNDNFAVAKDACSESEKPKKCKDDLLKAQRLWIQYKEAMAQVVMELNGGGSLSRLLADTFVVQETRKQARLLSGQE